MKYTSLKKYKHKTYGWIATPNGKIGENVYWYFNTLTNLYEFTKEEVLFESNEWLTLEYNDPNANS